MRANGLGTAVTLASMAALGEPLTFSTMILPSILLAVGAAYVMHILTAVRGQTDVDQLSASVVSVARPIALSGLTTALGFLAVSVVRIEAIQALGLYGSVGVLAVLAATLTLAPALIRLAPLGPGQAGLDGWIRGCPGRPTLSRQGPTVGAASTKRPSLEVRACK